MERSHALSRHRVIDLDDLRLNEARDATDLRASSLPDWLDGELPAAVTKLEMAMIQRAIDRSGGNRAEAARQLGIHRQLLYRKLRQYGME